MSSGTSSTWSRALLAIAILVSCIGCDQATKVIATQTLRGAPPRSYLGDTVRLEYALNPGGFLSVGAALGPDARFWLFVGFNTAMLAAIVWWLAKSRQMRMGLFVALVFVLAGGVGNLIDRVLNNGLVTDFLVLGIYPLQTGIINVADVALTFGGLACAFLYDRQSKTTAP